MAEMRMKTKNAAAQHRPTLAAKLGYATGDILGGGAFSLISLLFLNFLTNYEGIAPALAGSIVMVGKIWDAVTDPMMGVISDRTRSRWGRRRVYILAGALPVFVTFAMMWYCFGIRSMTGKAIYYTAAYMLFNTAFTIVMTPYNALLPDMIDDYKQRAGFSTIRLLLSNLATLVCVTLPSVMLGNEAVRTQKGYLVMGIVFGAFFALPLLVTFFSTWELPCADSRIGGFGEMFTQLKSSFANRAYRQYLGIFVCGQMATDICTTLLTYWLVCVLERTGITTLVSGVTMIVGVCVLPLNNWVAKKYGKQVPAVLLQPVRIVGLGAAFLLGAKSTLALIILVALLNGLGASASSFVPWTLLPDLPDSDEMMTGERNAGIYAGVSTFIRKSTSGIAIFVVSLLLQAFGYVESVAGETVQQSATVLLGVRILFCAVPMLLAAYTAWLAAHYTLTQENHAKMRAAVRVRKETGLPTQDPALMAACETITGRPFASMWVGRPQTEERHDER